MQIMIECGYVAAAFLDCCKPVSYAEYAYTLAAIDKSEFREWLFTIVKISGYGL